LNKAGYPAIAVSSDCYGRVILLGGSMIRNMIAALTLAVACMAASAQTPSTLSLNVGSYGHNCGPMQENYYNGVLTPTFNCTGIPVVQSNDVTICPTCSAVSYGTLFTNLIYDGRLNNINFGIDNLGSAQVLTLAISGNEVVATFAGPLTGETAPSYSGTLTMTYSTYRGCTTGRYASCGIHWTVTGGNVKFN
jgi:hypothetical protein